MAENEVTAFDANALKERIASQVQNTFGMLIPEEAFQKLVEENVHKFFSVPKQFELLKKRRETEASANRQSWNREYEDYYVLANAATPFEIMVWEATNKLAQTLLSEFLAEHRKEVEEAIMANVVEANAPKIHETLQQAMRGLMEQRAATQLSAALLAVQQQAFENVKMAFGIAGLPDAASHLSGFKPPMAHPDTSPT